ncbi:hypothetical protein K227x_14070 [Rubripirellula lacrimiformis]|uniref:Uncharacterized protein n=1 Tax=Rubripirellula lacrimiformis TaxID=1930273 RepID=A0A517N7Q4_9BACT|nr:hypothetical protein [Rubripirellula lacrimiformis]QDT03028.1 hypothetical protein K227x_14070 [Rubripirellula lacrimiformis]
MPNAALDPTEYIEQGFLFQLLRERLADDMPMQELLEQARWELLATTKLPMAIDYLLTELKHSGLMAPAMLKLGHYFTGFQTYLVSQSETDTGRFMISTALQIMEAEAKYRSAQPTPEGLFFYQFEVLCRNRLNYDKGLTAISSDPIFDANWAKWILMLRAQIGLVDIADLLFLASEEYQHRLVEAGQPTEGKGPFLFGRREGLIALGNRRKDPLFLFAAMQRHLGYPTVPRLKPRDQTPELIPALMRRVERLESRIKLMEEERRGGIDITKFYEKGQGKIPDLKDL